jgi:large subunit ribosomal protein L29
MKYSELSLKTSKELLEILANSKKEAMNLRFQRKAGESVKPSRIREVRKTVARIKTVLTKLKNSSK